MPGIRWLVDIVGTVVLPILGAVPDGCVVIFSGLGARDVVLTQVCVVMVCEMVCVMMGGNGGWFVMVDTEWWVVGGGWCAS